MSVCSEILREVLNGSFQQEAGYGRHLRRDLMEPSILEVTTGVYMPLILTGSQNGFFPREIRSGPLRLLVLETLSISAVMMDFYMLLIRTEALNGTLPRGKRSVLHLRLGPAASSILELLTEIFML